MNLSAVTCKFRTNEECLEHLEKTRWPDGVRCPTCGCNKVCKGTRKATAKNLRTRFYQCLEPTCKAQFSATNGTIFHRSHIPLSTWFMAITLIMDAKKGMSALQLQNHLGLGSYKTAWYMCHRIRKAMVDANETPLTGTVEIDETYIYGKTVRKKHRGNRWARPKAVVVGIRERQGPLRLFHIPDATKEHVTALVRANVSPTVEQIHTDQAPIYPHVLGDLKMLHLHRTVHHKIEFVSPEGNHTNTIESAFSLFKRGVIGSFHWISGKHLHRYLSEFEYRFNARKASDRFNMALSAMLHKPHMPYAELIA